MMISEKLLGLIQYRIEQEEASSRLYKAMAVWLHHNGYAGAGALWYQYANEEMDHAQWAYKFLEELNIKAEVNAIPTQPKEFEGLVDIIQKSYDHEILITQQIDALGKVAKDEDSYMTLDLVIRYQHEQIEELGKTAFWLDRLEAFGDDEAALRFLDNEMQQKAT